MAWSRGPGNIASININGGAPTIQGGLVENYGLATEPSEFDSAVGFSAERGYVTKRGTFTVLDYSAVAALNTLMQNGTLVDIIYTYSDAATQTVTDNRIRIKPVFNVVPDIVRVYARVASGSNNDALATTWSDLGPIIGTLNANFDYPFDGSDGAGRPYFSNGRVEVEFMLVGDSVVTDPYADIVTDSLRGVACDVAFLLPSGNFMVLNSVYLYLLRGDESASEPRSARVRLKNVVANWTSLIEYTDGAATGSATDAWGTETSGVDPGNYFAGCEVEAVGTGYAEPDFVTF